MTVKNNHVSAAGSHRRHFLMASLLFVALTAIGIIPVLFMELDRRAAERRELNGFGTVVAQSLERQLERSLSSTFTLATLIRQNEDRMIHDFDSVAAEIIETHGGIDSLQLAPGGIVSQIYPLEGNERGIGHDLLNDPARRVEALAAIEARSLTLAGPLELVQGGTAVIGRLPVFVLDEQGGERFWGFTIALIRLSDLLAETDLAIVVEHGDQYWLSRIHPDTGQLDVFAASAQREIQGTVTYNIEVPNGSWALHLRNPDNLSALWFAFEIILVVIFSAIASLLLYTRLQRAAARKFAQQALDLERQVAERTEELTVLYDISRILSQLGDFESKATMVMERLAQLTGAEWVTLRVERNDEPGLHLVAAAGSAATATPPIPVLTDTETLAYQALREGTIIVANDYANEANASPEILALGMKSMVLIPISSGDHTMGLVNVVSSKTNYFSPELVRLLTAVGEGLGTLLENAQLDQSRQMEAENSVMAELARVISSSLDIDDVYDRFGDEIRKLIPFDRIDLVLIDQERETVSPNWVLGTDIPDRRRGTQVPLAGSFAEVCLQGRSATMLEVHTEQDLSHRLPGILLSFHAGLRSFLGVPLFHRDYVVAFLQVCSKTQGIYSQHHLDLAERIGNQIAGAIANSQLYTDLKRAEEQIRASLQEKEVLLKEINHRVKNNLQIISSLLNLQSRDIQDEQALSAFQVSQDRIRAMALVHEKLYQSDDLARIDFGEYIKSLATDLRSSYGLGLRDIDLRIDVENIFLGVDTAIPCGVIVNELVANSLKHAFPGDRSGEIAVSFREDDGQYTMTFKDDGVGLPEDLDITHPSSLGLTIVNALTGQLGGTIDLVRNGGSEIRITFPAK